MKRRGDPELAAPRPKRTREVPGMQLPVPLGSLTGQPPSNFIWRHYSGRLKLLSDGGLQGRRAVVVVSRPRDVDSVWNNGYFGTLVHYRCWWDRAGLVIRDWSPGADFQPGDVEEVSPAAPHLSPHHANIANPDNASAEDFGGCDGEGEGAGNVNYDGKSYEEEDSNSDDDDDAISGEASSWRELKEQQKVSFAGLEEDGDGRELYLDISEAFYLSYALGCLTVCDSGKELSLLRMWQRYSQLEPDFPYRYAVYHHLRSKGWVVRAGHQMGSDWVLYRLGPAFYHASCTVRMEVVDSLTGNFVRTDSVPPLSWSHLLGLVRLSECVQKELLIARIEVQGLSDKELQSPHCLRKMAVSTHRFRRWIPGEKRWEVKPSVPVLKTTANHNMDQTDMV